MPDAQQRRPKNEDLEGILDLIWEGNSLRATCLKLGLHVPSTSDWLHADDARGGRREQYMRAREGRAEVLQEEALTVTKAAALGKKIDNQTVDASGSRAYLDAVKWATGKMAPKTHGDRIAHEHTGAGGGPIEYANLTRDQRKARIAELQERAARAPDDPGGD